MTYTNALNYVKSLERFGSKPGLSRIALLLERMGNPQNSLKFVHVAGTNGKGSVCTMLSSILEKAGYKTGLFISPYVVEFLERIQINNAPIRRGDFVKAVEIIAPLTEELKNEGVIITEFEFITAVAFFCFNLEKCDIVVLETGLGGRFDATNAISRSLCSVVTSISLDHTDILGDTLEQIAFEKSGIFKENGVAIIAPQPYPQAKAELIARAEEKNCRIVLAENLKATQLSTSLEKTVISVEFADGKAAEINLALIGGFQLENVRTTLATVIALQSYYDCSIPFSAVKSGLESVRHPARLEVIRTSPLVLLDGAHNPGSIAALAEVLKGDMDTHEKICVFGMLRDKDADECIRLLKGLFTTIITVPINNPRSFSEFELAQKCREHFANVIPSSGIPSAFETAYSLASQNNMSLVICGSLYLAAEIRPYILKAVGKYKLSFK
ncbi:MAG: bifunctional folylpolyglutamate synthase/dihydrofolate synthase [Oscillospiraceae bacterium]|jgi:dihydrofolate synthase/folylpolyglutamate synthase|nr:bifunctional folylpolyglutamate synthase/dihydrofolate synthase [Oscillospiraceae bacterium]